MIRFAASISLSLPPLALYLLEKPIKLSNKLLIHDPPVEKPNVLNLNPELMPVLLRFIDHSEECVPLSHIIFRLSKKADDSDMRKDEQHLFRGRGTISQDFLDYLAHPLYFLGREKLNPRTRVGPQTSRLSSTRFNVSLHLAPPCTSSDHHPFRRYNSNY